MKFSPRLKTAAAATAFFLPLGLAANASAQDFAPGLGDDGTVEVIANVVAAMSVIGGDEINLGQIAEGADPFDVLADNDSVFSPALFRIDGPAGLDWEIEVQYNDLTATGTSTSIVIGPPSAGDVVCFMQSTAEGALGTAGQCDVPIGNVTGTIVSADHGGEGNAQVGFSVDVSDEGDAAAGFTFSNEDAVRLIAEARLGTGS